MAEIKDLVHRVVVILDALKLSYVIVGGFAAIMRSIPRTTMDLDLIVENDPVKVSLFFNALKTNTFDVIDEQVKMAMSEGSSISIFDAHSPLRVDIKIARKTDDIDALKNGIWETYNDIKMRIASPELILFGKVLYIGDISTETDADLLEFNDVRDFINVYMHSENLNMGWLNAKVAKKRLTETYNRLMALATKEAEQS
jgi:hypothetical protein